MRGTSGLGSMPRPAAVIRCSVQAGFLRCLALYNARITVGLACMMQILAAIRLGTATVARIFRECKEISKRI